MSSDKPSDDLEDLFDLNALHEAAEAEDYLQIVLQCRLIKQLNLKVDFEHVGALMVKNHCAAIGAEFGKDAVANFLRGIRGSTSN